MRSPEGRTMHLDVRALALALRGHVDGKQVVCPGPGHSRHDRSLSVRPSADAPNGFIVHSFAGDDWQACQNHVLRCLGMSARRIAYANPAVKTRLNDRADSDGVSRARQIWAEATDPRGTIVQKYLESRELSLPECGDYALRFHPACPWERGRIPAMVAAFRSLANDRIITGIHRTALTYNGQKIGRKMLGRPRDAAIMLDRYEDVTAELAIAEGIESALAGRQLGLRPCWVAGSAGAIGCFPLLGGIERLNVLAELDDSGANARAIQEVGQRWAGDGREVLIITPRHGGDMNDALGRCV